MRIGAVSERGFAGSFIDMPLYVLQAGVRIACTRVGDVCKKRFSIYRRCSNPVPLIATGAANILLDMRDAPDLLA